MNAITAQEPHNIIDINYVQPEQFSGENLINVCPIPTNFYGNLGFMWLRVISEIAVLHQEMICKRILVLGPIMLPPKKLIVAFNVEIRRVRLIAGYPPDLLFQIEDHRAGSGYKLSSTPVSEDAFLNDWDFVVARQSANRAVLGESALSLIRKFDHKIYTRELLLMPIF